MRWKNWPSWLKRYLVLLFLLTAIFLVLSETEFVENLIVYATLDILIFVVAVSILLFSLSFTEKRITNKEFSYKWLFLFNLKFFPILVVIFEIFITIFWITLSLIFRFGGEGTGMGLLIFWISCPFVALGYVIFFSLIPSIIIYKFYNKDSQKKISLKLIYAINGGLIALIISFFILFLDSFEYLRKSFFQPLHTNFIGIIFNPIVAIIIGAVIGFIIGKIKEKKK